LLQLAPVRVPNGQPLHVNPLLLSIKALKVPQKRKWGGKYERASRKEERAGWEMWSKVRTSCRTSQGKGQLANMAGFIPL